MTGYRDILGIFRVVDLSHEFLPWSKAFVVCVNCRRDVQPV